jgi:16S rRNA U1498 N3-methylase RsmE
MKERDMEVELRNGRVFHAKVLLVQDGAWVRIRDDKAHDYEAELLPISRIKHLRYDYESMKDPAPMP